MKLNEISQEIWIINLLSKRNRPLHMKNQMDKFDFKAFFSAVTDSKDIINPTLLRDSKGTKGAVEICQANKISFEVLPRLSNEDFLQELSKFKSLAFTPLVFETYSRVCAEARMIGLDILTNTNVSFCLSDLSQLKGKELINVIRENNNYVASLF